MLRRKGIYVAARKKSSQVATLPAPNAIAISNIEDLTLDPDNARKHGERDIDAIAASLSKFGQQSPIIIDAKKVVIKGNGTLMAAMKLGWTQVETRQTSLTGAQLRAYAIADNRTAELSQWDEDKLLEQLQSFDEQSLIDSCGFNDSEMAALLDSLLPEVVEPPGDFPEAGEDIETKYECPSCKYKWS